MRLSGISNLFQSEISAKVSPVLDRYSPKMKRDAGDPERKSEEGQKVRRP